MKAKLLKGTVEGIPLPPSGEITVWDTELPGFVLRVRPSGRFYYIYYRTAGGTKRWYKLGQHGVVTPAKAREEATQHLAAVARGEDPFASKDRARHGQTIADFLPSYFAHFKPRWRPRTHDESKRLWETIITPALGNVKLTELSKARLIAFKTANEERPTTANRCIAQIRALCNLAIDLGLLATNPTAGVKLYDEVKHDAFLSTDQVRAVLAAIDAEEADGQDTTPITRVGESKGRGGLKKVEIRSRGISLHQAALLRILIYTGARLREIMDSEWSWYDLDAGVLQLPEEASKTGKRSVWLSAPVVEELNKLQRMRTQQRWVIEGKGTGGKLVNITKAWHRVRKRAAASMAKPGTLATMRVHDLRHSFASFGVAAGVPLMVVGKSLGHSQARTTERYAHLADNPVRDAVHKIGEVIRSAAEGKPAEVVEIAKDEKPTKAKEAAK